MKSIETDKTQPLKISEKRCKLPNIPLCNHLANFNVKVKLTYNNTYMNFQSVKRDV